MPAHGRRRQDIASWQEQLSASFVRLDVVSDGSLRALDTRLATAQKGKARAARVDVVGEPHVVRRTPHAASQDDGGILVSVQLRGSCIVRQLGREAHLRPGDIAWYDTTRPYDLVFPEGSHRQVVLQVRPEDFLQSRPLSDSTAIRLPGDLGVGRAVAPLLRAIPHSMQDAETVQTERIAQMAVDMLLLALPGPPRSSAPDLLESARRFVEDHADDPDLSPSRVASAVHLSLGHLHRIFRRSDTTLSTHLKLVRLRNAANDLRDPVLGHWTIVDIARRRGFRDPATFSRAFHARYGMSPTEWRCSAG